MTARIVVAIEASHPEPLDGLVVEIGWADVGTGARGVFIPAHNVEHVMQYGHPRTMRRIHYNERIAGARQDDGTQLADLHDRLSGATLVSAYPRRDADFLTATFRRGRLTPSSPWRTQLDIPSMAFGARTLGLSEVPSVHELSERFGLLPGNDTAAGDLAAALLVYRMLRGGAT